MGGFCPTRPTRPTRPTGLTGPTGLTSPTSLTSPTNTPKTVEKNTYSFFFRFFFLPLWQIITKT